MGTSCVHVNLVLLRSRIDISHFSQSQFAKQNLSSLRCILADMALLETGGRLFIHKYNESPITIC